MSPHLTKFERTHVVGVRAEQLARGAQPFVEVPPPVQGASANSVFLSIAERELDANLLPLTVVRKMPDGSEAFVPL
jgi:DNA-directed RNA polymerase I, II, and III subunit RPABC2